MAKWTERKWKKSLCATQFPNWRICDFMYVCFYLTKRKAKIAKHSHRTFDLGISERNGETVRLRSQFMRTLQRERKCVYLWLLLDKPKREITPTACLIEVFIQIIYYYYWWDHRYSIRELCGWSVRSTFPLKLLYKKGTPPVLRSLIFMVRCRIPHASSVRCVSSRLPTIISGNIILYRKLSIGRTLGPHMKTSRYVYAVLYLLTSIWPTCGKILNLRLMKKGRKYMPAPWGIDFGPHTYTMECRRHNGPFRFTSQFFSVWARSLLSMFYFCDDKFIETIMRRVVMAASERV